MRERLKTCKNRDAMLLEMSLSLCHSYMSFFFRSNQEKQNRKRNLEKKTRTQTYITQGLSISFKDNLLTFYLNWDSAFLSRETFANFRDEIYFWRTKWESLELRCWERIDRLDGERIIWERMSLNTFWRCHAMDAWMCDSNEVVQKEEKEEKDYLRIESWRGRRGNSRLLLIPSPLHPLSLSLSCRTFRRSFNSFISLLMSCVSCRSLSSILYPRLVFLPTPRTTTGRDKRHRLVSFSIW
jgi:hypothetical protein